MAAKLTSSYLPELSSTIFGRKGPAMVTVNLTNRCDQRCIYCEIGQGIELPKNDVLTVDDLKWILDEMSFNRIPKISLCGGEPFLFKGITEVVSYAASKKIRTSITTNGMTLHHLPDAELLILKNCGTEINVSIDSFDQEIQSLTRGTGTALDNALKSIARLKEFDIPVTVLCAISKFNYHDLSIYVEKACKLNIRQILFQPLIFTTNYPGQRAVDQKIQLNVNPEQFNILEQELKKILRFESHHPVKTNVYRITPWIQHYLSSVSRENGPMFFQKVLKKFYCREIDAIIDISFDGGIQPCGLARAHVNIFENRSLGLIHLWKLSTADLKQQLEKEQYPAICNSCCHHFSRNMIASVMRDPFQNRKALLIMLPLFSARFIHSLKKKIIFRNI